MLIQIISNHQQVEAQTQMVMDNQMPLHPQVEAQTQVAHHQMQTEMGNQIPLQTQHLHKHPQVEMPMVMDNQMHQQQVAHPHQHQQVAHPHPHQQVVVKHQQVVVKHQQVAHPDRTWLAVAIKI
tara:strand:+ start:65 stop:436 length:372 start_codon:yes stop_codon:yes gene_type:complete